MDPIDALRNNDRPHEIPPDISLRIEARMYGALEEEVLESRSSVGEVIVNPGPTGGPRGRRFLPLVVGVAAAAAVAIVGIVAVGLARQDQDPDQQVTAVTNPTAAMAATPDPAPPSSVPTAPGPAELREKLDGYCEAIRLELAGISWRGEELLRTWPKIEDQHAELDAVIQRALEELPTVVGMDTEPAALSQVRSSISGIANRMTGYRQTFVTNSWETVAGDIPAELTNLVEVLDQLAVLGAPSCAQ